SDGWLKGDRVVRQNPSAGNIAEIVCTTAGTANNTAWAPSTAHTAGNRVNNGGNVYRCTTAGTSDASGGPSGTGYENVDGTGVRAYVAPLAVFKTKATLAA